MISHKGLNINRLKINTYKITERNDKPEGLEYQ
jgi:hypothetical protein